MDRRDQNRQWYDRFDEVRMVIILEAAREVKDDHEFDPEHQNEAYCVVCGASETDHCGAYLEDVEIPAVFEVCGTCEGKGSHVNPSIDAHGISAEEFAEDPDFAEAYWRGDYDQPCNECGGRRVVPVVSPDASDELKKLAEEAEQAHYDDQRCREAEMRWGY